MMLILELRRLGTMGSAVLPIFILSALADNVRPHTFPANPDDAVLVAAWWLAFAVALWFAASVGFWVLAEKLPTSPQRRHWHERGAQWTMPGSRHLARGVFAASTLVIPACSTSGPEAPILHAVDVNLSDQTFSANRTSASSQSPTTQLPHSTTSTAADSSSTTSSSTVELAPEPPPIEVGIGPHPIALSENAKNDESGATYTVQEGDSLWSIAQAHTTRGTSSHLSTHVSSYWRQLIQDNAASLRSGDPNLIFVGETINLPPLSSVTAD